MTSAVEQPTLVLNRNWQPVNITPVARALVMVWNGTARVVEPDSFQLYDWSDWAKQNPAEGESFIQAVTTQLRVPEIITLTGYDRLPNATVTFSRRNIFKRDRFKCQYCGIKPPRVELTLDHVVPRAQGGESSWKNCVLACLECNSRKANRTPTEAGMKLCSVPDRPTWRPLYAVSQARYDSWSQFVSESYWNANLKE